jgi:hypothetical protein
VASDTPIPVLAAETTPAFETVQLLPAPPSTPSAVPVEVTVPVFVIYRGLSVAGPRTTGPVTLVVIVFDIGFTQLLLATSWPCPVRGAAELVHEWA